MSRVARAISIIAATKLFHWYMEASDSFRACGHFCRSGVKFLIGSF